VRAQDETPNLGGLSNSTSAVAKQPTPVGAGTYDDAHTAWTYSSGWSTYSGAGPYSNTLHYSGTVGSYGEVTFDGTKFTLTYVKASNRGLIDVYVDGTKIQTVNAYSATWVWGATWTSPTLSAGTHTVRFVHASGAYIDLDAIQVHGPPPPPVGAGTYDDAHTAWAYSSGWSTYSGAGPYSNTLHYSGTVGSYGEVTFDGTKFTLTYVKASNRGLIDVYVDGTKIQTVNAYSATWVWGATWTSPTLSGGTHTVRFVHASGAYIDLDAIQIMP
jgi:hypothetical protein